MTREEKFNLQDIFAKGDPIQSTVSSREEASMWIVGIMDILDIQDSEKFTVSITYSGNNK